MERIRRDRQTGSSNMTSGADDTSTVRRRVRAVEPVSAVEALARVPSGSVATFVGREGVASRIRRSETDGIIRRYKSMRADDGGDFIGEPSACHCHINVGKPHFKVGKADSTRINFGRDMSLERMQRAYETMLAGYEGTAGFADCKEYFEEKGCEPPDPGNLVKNLKGMLVKWGGLSDQVFSYYTAGGKREEVDAHSPERLDAEIEAHQEQIHESYVIYNDFLDEGGFASEKFADLDEEAMDEEAQHLYEEESRTAKNAAKKVTKAKK
jgi:hypothetical protein